MSDPNLTQLHRDAHSYYGKYRGFVVNNEDPDKLGRLQVRVPSVLGEATSGWALPCLPFGGLANQGLFLLPEVDAQIWVEFEEGNRDYPIWSGVFWQQTGDIPAEADAGYPTTRVLRTPSGHLLQFDDASGKELVLLQHKDGAKLRFDEKGSVLLEHKSGSKLVLDVDASSVTLKESSGHELVMDGSGVRVKDTAGNEIRLEASGITIKGTQIIVDGTSVALGGQGGEPLLKGTSFLALFATHMHTTGVPGSPTSPPIPQGEASALTTRTTAQ